MIYIALGLIAFAGGCGFYLLYSVYRTLSHVLKDPDTYKLLDGKESE